METECIIYLKEVYCVQHHLALIVSRYAEEVRQHKAACPPYRDIYLDKMVLSLRLFPSLEEISP